MATLLVGYDLNRNKNYEPLWEKLRSYGPWWHHLDSTWIIKADLTAKELRDQLAPLIDRDDELLVIDVSGNARAWKGFDDSGSTWLKQTF